MRTQKLNLDEFAVIICSENELTNDQLNHLRGGDDVEDPKIYIKK